MDFGADTSLPPSREVSPMEHARRLTPPQLNPPAIAEGSAGDFEQQSQEQQEGQQEGQEQTLQQGPGGDAPAGAEAEAEAEANGGADEAEAAGQEAVSAPGVEGNEDGGMPSTIPEGGAEGEDERGATGVGSEPSGDAGDPAANDAAAAAAMADAAAAGVSASAGGRSISSSSVPSRGSVRGITGVRGVSKSFSVGGRESPTRQIRSRGSLAVVRELNRTPSAQSSRPASSMVAPSSVPPSPDPYGSEGVPGTSNGIIGLWPPTTVSLAAPGSPFLDDVEVRGAAMRIRLNSNVARDGAVAAVAAAASGGVSRSLTLTASPSPPGTSPSPLPGAAAAAAAHPPPGTPPSPAAGAAAANPAVAQAQQVAAQDSSQHLPSSSGIPSMAMGTSPVMMAASRNRPMVMPFLERHQAAGAVSYVAASTAAAAAGMAPGGVLGMGPAVGRRQGPHGSIRHGPAYQQQPLPGSSSQGSAPNRESITGGVRRSARGTATDPHRPGIGPPSDAPGLAARTPAATGDGVPDELPAPPLYAVPSREWDRPRAGAGGAGYAAGGGASAAKAVAASAGGLSLGKSIAGVSTSADLQLQQQLMLGEAIKIRSVQKAGAAPGMDPQSVSASAMGLAGVPGRRGRRLPAHPSNASATAAAMAAYFASVEASIADGTAADRVLLPSGLARRLKAARMMAAGPPPFQRQRKPPPPPSPSGIKLDGFMLLEAADEEMPEAVQFASLESRHISAVESADLSYFVALRTLDVSDNKLPDLICLATLQALVRLRAASCRLATLGPWPGSLTSNTESGGGAAAAAGASGGGEARPTAAQTGSSAAAGVLRRHRTRAALMNSIKSEGGAGVGGSASTTEPGEAHESRSVAPDGVSPADLPPSQLPPPPPPPSQQHQGLAQRAEGTGGTTSPEPASAEGGRLPSEGAVAPPAAAAPTAPAGTEAALVASLLAPINGRPFQFLEILDLSFNQLQPHMVLLPTSPLALLPRLAELDLSSNHFKHLPSPAEIAAAAAKVAAAAATGANPAAAAVGVAFPSLRRLRLADNGLKGGAIASLAALAPPALTHLDLSRNAISEAPRLKYMSLAAEDSFDSLASSTASPLPPRYANANGGATMAQQQQRQGGLQQQPSSASLKLQQQSSQHRLLQQQASHASSMYADQLQPPPQQQQMAVAAAQGQDRERLEQERFGSVLVRLAVLDLTFNKVVSEGSVAPLLHLPALQRLLLAGNPLAVTAQRPGSQRAAAAGTSKLDFGEPHAPPLRPTVAASLTARFAKIPEAAPKQQATTLAAAAAAVITAAVAPERVTEAYERLDATIEQWRLNTVMEEDEEEDEEGGDEDAGDDRTFLTGVGIQERRRKGSATTAASAEADATALEAVAEILEEEVLDEGATAPAAATSGGEERPLWESITDPTERVAVALGLDPLTLPMHTGALTTDSAGAIAALRFALAHPLVEANDGLAPHPGYAATTTAAQLKRKPRRPAPTQRLAPMGAGAGSGGGSATAAASGGGAAAATAVAAAAAAVGSGPKAAKILTVEAMLEGMKGKLAALEASLAAQLATAPTAPSAEAVRRAEAASRARYGGGRRGNETDSEEGEGDGDAGSTGSDLPEDVIDQIERESESEADDERAVEEEMGQMDPKQGIVLLADQLMAEEAAAEADGIGKPVPVGGEPSQSLHRGGLASASAQPSRNAVTLSSSPPQQAPSPLRTAAPSPRRVGASSPGGVSQRKGVSIGGTTTTAASTPFAAAATPAVPATPIVLPGGAASALGYAS